MLRRLCSAVAVAVFALPAVGQKPPPNVLPEPRLNNVMPMGAKAGSTVELTVFGTDLDDPTALRFSHPGITAEFVPPPEPPADPKKKDPPKKPTVPPTQHKYKVTVSGDTPPGTHDVRIVTKLGVSNPRAFVVGTLPEVLETDKPHDDVPDAQRVELNSVVNGTIASTSDVDYYAFAGKSNQRVLVNCRTGSIDSRCRPLVEVFSADGRRLGENRNYQDTDALADVTLPADGDYLVRVCEFAYQGGSPEHFYRLSISTGPWIDAVVPNVIPYGKPAEVTVYGRNLPGGKPADGVTVDGVPVEALTVTVTPPADVARDELRFREIALPPQALEDGFEYRLPGSNGVPVFFTDAPLHREQQDAPNDSPDSAEAIPVPCDVTGTLGKRYDKDWFAFDAKKGDSYRIELYADRLGAGVDTFYVVKNSQNMGNVLPEQDDDTDPLHPQQFFNRTGDAPAATFTAPADGKYLILVGSRDGNVSYGPRCTYRLRVSAPAPDFRAVVMPDGRDLAGGNLGYAGGRVALDVLIDRRDGFSEPITVTADGLPPGVTAKPAVIGTNQRWGSLLLDVADNAAEFTGPIRVKCSTTIDGKPLTRDARPASITWSVPNNNNVPMVVRVDRELTLAVRPEKAQLAVSVDRPAMKVKTKVDGKDAEIPAEFPLYVKPGDKLLIPVKAGWKGAEARPNPVNVRYDETHPNRQLAPLTVQGGNPNNPIVAIPKDKSDATINVDVRPNAAPGLYTVHLRADTQIQFLRDPEDKNKKSNAVIQAFADPVEVTVLPLTLGKFTLAPPPNNQLKAGGTTELVLKVERQFDYAGEFKVEVTLPPEAKGLTVKPVTLPAGANEVTIPIEVAADTKDGGNYQVSVVATATVHGKFPVTHEAKASGLRVVAEKKDK